MCLVLGGSGGLNIVSGIGVGKVGLVLVSVILNCVVIVSCGGFGSISSNCSSVGG